LNRKEERRRKTGEGLEDFGTWENAFSFLRRSNGDVLGIREGGFTGFG